MGIIKKIFSKKEKVDPAELKASVLKKATEHWDANKDSNAETKVSTKTSQGYEVLDKVKKKNARAILLEIADRGETGVLPTSISDVTGINPQDTATALAFLTKEEYVDAVNSVTGFKYYLTEAGRKYCISKEFNSDI